MLATRLDVIGSDNLLLVFLCPRRHYGGLESCQKKKKRRSVRHQANLALLHHVSQQFPAPAASSAHVYPLESAYLFCFLKKKTDSSTTWIRANYLSMNWRRGSSDGCFQIWLRPKLSAGFQVLGLGSVDQGPERRDLG